MTFSYLGAQVSYMHIERSVAYDNPLAPYMVVYLLSCEYTIGFRAEQAQYLVLFESQFYLSLLGKE